MSERDHALANCHDHYAARHDVSKTFPERRDPAWAARFAAVRLLTESQDTSVFIPLGSPGFKSRATS
jgi:hypothetical protein